MAEIETVFNSVSDKEDLAWLIQWVIEHKLVCDIIYLAILNTNVSIRATNSYLFFQDVGSQNIG